MKRVWNYIVTMWQPAGMFIIGAVSIGSLVPGANTAEVAGRTSSLKIHTILDDPVNAPYKTARYLARKVHNTMTSERLISGVMAGLAIILFYLVVRHFCSRYAAALATIMFATSTSLLTIGRMAMPNILLLMLLGLLACGYLLRFGSHPTRAWLATSVILGLSLYVPGMIYFIIGGTAWQFRAVRRTHKRPEPLLVGACVAVFVLLVAPLVYGFINSPQIWREYLGLPTHVPTIIGFLKSFLAVPFGIFVWAPRNAAFRLGRQPLLDIFGSIMFILGCYALVKRYRLDRLVLLFGIFLAAALYTAVSGNYENSFVLLPFIYFCIAIGIGMLLEQWRKVFPLNPLARGLALVIVALAVLVSVNFQARRYFIAWPHNPQTRAMFTLK
jgi:phage shock protein PspC (stress-responsive transcriptional regulator)